MTWFHNKRAWAAREVVAAKTYSMETAVRYVYGQGFGMDISVLTDEEKEAIERARYCRQQLLRLKARRAAQEAGEADNSQILQQEEVEEWLANIELRLRQQSRKLGISAAELPIWIAPHLRRDLKIGNIASAAKAAAAAIRLSWGFPFRSCPKVLRPTCFIWASRDQQCHLLCNQVKIKQQRYGIRRVIIDRCHVEYYSSGQRESGCYRRSDGPNGRTGRTQRKNYLMNVVIVVTLSFKTWSFPIDYESRQSKG